MGFMFRWLKGKASCDYRKMWSRKWLSPRFHGVFQQSLHIFDRLTFVPQQILGGCVIRERIDNLLGGPRRRWYISNVEVNDFAPFMIQDDQHVEQTSGHRRNHKEIHRGNASHMVLEKGPPAL